MVFLVGCSSSLPVLQSFCFFAGIGMLFMYMACISLFTAFMTWDIRRQVQRKGDCCGLCRCKETTRFCCKGKFLSERQRRYPYQGNFDEDQLDHMPYNSFTQKMIHRYYAPALTSKRGIIATLLFYLGYFCFTIYSLGGLDIDIKTSYFIRGDSLVRMFLDKEDFYYTTGTTITIYTDGKLNFTHDKTQDDLIYFNNELLACKNCAQAWTIPNSFQSWYLSMRAFAITYRDIDTLNGVENKCKDSWDSDKEIVKSSKFMDCLRFFLKQPQGGSYRGSILFSEEDKHLIIGFKQKIEIVHIQYKAKEGVQFLQDIRNITDGGPAHTYSFGNDYYNYECYRVFVQEMAYYVGEAVVSVVIIHILMTGDIITTAFVTICVLSVEFFLFGLLPLWDVKLNSVTVVNVVVALGLAVDYSAHIAHAYLQVTPPQKNRQGKPLTNHQKRVYKTVEALGLMGKGVFHGGFSTLLAIVVLSPSDSYIMSSSFKMWFGIVIFGVGNGFLLLPVLLALCGPLNK